MRKYKKEVVNQRKVLKEDKTNHNFTHGGKKKVTIIEWFMKETKSTKNIFLLKQFFFDS